MKGGCAVYTISCTHSSATSILIMAIIYSSYHVANFLTFQMSGVIWDWWYCRNCDVDASDQVNLPHWRQRLLPLPCSSDPGHSMYSLACLTIFHMLSLHVYLAIFYHNSHRLWMCYAWSGANAVSRLTHQRTVQCASISNKTTDDATRARHTSSKLH